MVYTGPTARYDGEMHGTNRSKQTTPSALMSDVEIEDRTAGCVYVHVFPLSVCEMKWIQSDVTGSRLLVGAPHCAPVQSHC